MDYIKVHGYNEHLFENSPKIIDGTNPLCFLHVNLHKITIRIKNVVSLNVKINSVQFFMKDTPNPWLARQTCRYNLLVQSLAIHQEDWDLIQAV